MEGLRHMHSQNICHRDIKLENLLLNSDFMLKIADFGFACLIEGDNKSGVLTTRLGTEGYMAPEIYLMKYSGVKVDVFAAGVVLFIMLSGHPPFQKAVVTDPYFKLIRDKKGNVFWTQHSKRKSINFYS
jgi:serine/threonine protein kinase